MECPACQAAIRDGARFCSECGHALTMVGDERRVVTVLFADLVGFTSLSEASDPEQVKNLVDRCFQRLVAVIESYGGKVDKIIGDAVVALFGAPIAHEDDAERAVRAALRMQEILADGRRDFGGELELRVGVNTGEVLVGALRAGGDYTAMGDVVNTAQRLETAAAPGEVVVGPATKESTGDRITYDARGLLEVKGRDETVDAWAATGATRPPGYRRRRDDGPLVGRRSELAQLTAAIDTSVSRRRAQFLLLVGDAGVGKSRLAAEMATYARITHDALILEGRCVPYGEANVWWPVAEALRQAAGLDGDEVGPAVRVGLGEMVASVLDRSATDAEVLRITEGLLYLTGQEGPLRDLDPARAREEATWALLTVIEAFAARSPVVVILADLHWADEYVLVLIDQLMERLGRLPYVVVGTARHAIHDRWAPRPGRHNSAIVHLEPLDREASCVLLDSLLGWEPDDELRDELLDRSGGNPFFLEELVTLLSESGDGGRRRSPTPSGDLAGLPDTLRGLIQARLDALGTDERFLLEDAAILGRRGSREALSIMAGEYHGIVDIAAGLSGLAEKELLEIEGDRWAFRSDLVRDVAYGTLTKARRATGHAGIAKWMEHNVGGEDATEAVIDRIAHHFAIAADMVAEVGQADGVPDDVRERALEWLERAADVAMHAEHLLVGVRLTSQILDLVDDDAGPEAVRSLTRRARCRVGLRELDDARADLTKALAHAEARDDEAAFAEALVVLGDLEMKSGDAVTSREILTRAARLLTGVGLEGVRGEALRLRGMAELFLGEREAATASIEEALTVARAAGSQREEAWALQNLAWTAFESGHAEVAETHLEASVAAFTAIGDTGGLGWAQGLLAWVKFHHGDHAAAEELAERLLPATHARGDKWAEGMILMLLGSVRMWSGRAEEAIAPTEDAAATLSKAGDLGARVQAVGLLARVLVATGRIDDGLEAMHRARTLGDETDQPMGFAGLVVSVLVPVALGDPALAMEALDALDIDGLDVEAIGQSDAVLGVALAFLQDGQVERAAQLLGRMGGDPDPGAYPASASALALARAAVGDHGEVDRLVAGTLASPRATYHDKTQALLAAMLSDAAAGDTDQALERAQAARELAGGTQDRLLQSVVGVISAEALGDAAVDAPALPGVSASGWRNVARLALGASPLSRS
jgi:class 3 adenylate cyclase/tetratricopeptide (TPR) repeat protein